MKEKNRFSSLLKHLLSVSKLKNYYLAKELQYDESYISKWVNGSLLPTEKTSEKIFREISRCIVASLDNDTRATFYSEYQVDVDTDLEAAIFDNLVAEYRYVMGLKETTGSEIAMKTVFYPELTLTQFLQKMRHPSLRQVKTLDTIAAMDILALDKNYQLSIAEPQNLPNVNMEQRAYPGVHFSMLINLEHALQNTTANAQFVLNLLTNFSNVDFQLYTYPQVQGKLIFSIKDIYCISGMIMDESHCIAVSTSEETKSCSVIHERLQSMCSQEHLAIRRTEMEEMLRGKEYINFMFSRNQRWLLGHFTEHILPDDLFEELTEDYCRSNPKVSREALMRARIFGRSVVENTPVRVLAYENALNEFAATGMLDFFNTKMYLTPEQRIKALRYAVSLYNQNPKLSFRYLRDGALSDMRHIPDPTMCLSDTYCYLRLNRFGPKNNLSVINKVQLADLFRSFFDEVWEDTRVTETDTARISEAFQYAVQMTEVQLPYQR